MKGTLKNPLFKLGDTVVLTRRWFLWFREPVLCEIVHGRYVTDSAECNYPEWRYTLKIGKHTFFCKTFCIWESELLEFIK